MEAWRTAQEKKEARCVVIRTLEPGGAASELARRLYICWRLVGAIRNILPCGKQFFLRRYVKEISTNYVLGKEKVCNFNS